MATRKPRVPDPLPSHPDAAHGRTPARRPDERGRIPAATRRSARAAADRQPTGGETSWETSFDSPETIPRGPGGGRRRSRR